MSKCKSKWDSKRKPSNGDPEETEKIDIETDTGGVLTGKHDSGQGVGGKCLGNGMTLTRPDDNTFPRYIYSGVFVEGSNEKKVRGTYVVVENVDSKLDAAGGDWEADKTT